MRQQGLQDSSWTETDAMRLVQRLDAAESLQDRRMLLERAVEDEVIPRLVDARRAAAHAAIAPHQVAALVTLALTATQSAVDEALEAALGDFDAVMLDMVTPTARRLGEMWEDDTATFSDVTLATLRLCRAVHTFSAAHASQAPAPGAPRVLLAPMPGEQHGPGLIMLGQFFRRAGWDVQQDTPRAARELTTLAARRAFDIVGLSLSDSSRMDQLAALIAAIRQSSRNPAILIMVGGPPFLSAPCLADQVGADSTATDGAQAVRQAHALLSRQVCPA